MATIEVQPTRASGSNRFNQFCSGARTAFGRIAENTTVCKVAAVIFDADFLGKVSKLAYKCINLHNCLNGTNHLIDVVEGLKGVCSALDILESYDNFIFWIHPFSKKTVDKSLIATTLQTSLNAHETTRAEGERRSAQEISEVVNQVVQRVFGNEDLPSVDVVRLHLTNALQLQGYDFDTARAVTGGVTIHKKSRTFISCVISACFTAANLIGSIETLRKYNILDFTILTSKIAAVMGNSKVFIFFYDLGPGTIISSLSGIGLFLVIGMTTHSLIVKIITVVNAENDEEKTALKREIFALSRKLIVVSLDFVVCVAPLVCTVNPPLLLALSITSKSLGIINAFLR